MNVQPGGGVLVPGIVHSQVPECRYSDTGELADAVAARLTERVRAGLEARGAASLAVPGGRTPTPVFDRLCRMALDWSRVIVVLTDERWVPVDHPDSNEGLVRGRLLHERAVAASVFGLYRPTALPSQALDAVENDLAGVPRPFDAVLLGMGEDGHFASLFPGAAALRAGLMESGARDCMAIDAPRNGHARLSLTLSALLQARVIVLMYQGAAKRAVFETARCDPGARTSPVAALLRQRRAPLEVHWSN